MNTQTTIPAAQQTEPDPRPFPTISPFEKEITRRRLDCRVYDRCLNDAAEQDWPGFTCDGCGAYQGIARRELATRDLSGLLRAASYAIENSGMDIAPLPEDAAE
jgi:hypothetical protein